MKIFLFTLILVVCLSNGQDECKPASCGPNEPVVQFPFWLKDQQPEHCGYPGFELSCTQSGRTQLEFQFPVTVSTNNVAVPLTMTISVWLIDYKAQKMLVRDAVARSCLPERLPTLNSSAAFPFEVEPLGYDGGLTLFNCTITKGRDYGNPIACLSSRSYQVIPFASIYDITSLPSRSPCFRMYNVSFLPDNVFARVGDDYSGTAFYLRWRKPDCQKCEGKGKYCRMSSNRSTAGEETECFKHGASRKNNPLAAGVTVGTVLLVLVSVVLFFVLRSVKRKKVDQERLEKALENHKHMRAMIRCSYADIKRITSNYKEKLGKSGSLYKGMFEDKTPVAVKTIDDSSIEDLINEVDTIGQLHHDNILQLIGYCAYGSKKALVYETLPCGTLDSVLSSDIDTLDWEALRRILTGVAKGIAYIHKEHNQEIDGLNISPHEIFLDSGFNPKVMVCPLDADQEATYYTAPELLSTSAGIVHRKADVYSFGMIMLDIVGRMRKIDTGEKERDEPYYPEWIHNEMKEEEEEDNWVLKKVGGVGLWCIEWFPCDRPSMEAVVQMLEGDDMPVVPTNPFVSSKCEN